MAVSYRTSLQNRNQDASAAVSEINPINSEEITDTEEYTPCSDGRYKWYTKYHDTNYSTIDAQKGISMDASQVNITQETLSLIHISAMMPISTTHLRTFMSLWPRKKHSMKSRLNQLKIFMLC